MFILTKFITPYQNFVLPLSRTKANNPTLTLMVLGINIEMNGYREIGSPFI